MKTLPPKRMLQFLRWFCREDYLEEIEGDLTEVFLKQYETSSRRAKWKFGWSVIKYFRPEFIKSLKYHQPNEYGMYKSYFKIGWRNLVRHRSFTLINISGLILGITSALFIYLITNHELSYDQYHAKANRIYRINNGTIDNWDSGTPYSTAQIVRNEIPEVEQASIIWRLNPEFSNIEINKELFRETGTFFVQPEAFQLFDFEWLQGSPEKSLSNSKQAVIARSIAEKYFDGDAMGKVLRINNGTDYIISGIINDPPTNSDFPIKIALSFITVESQKDSGLTEGLDAGSNSFFQTYMLLKEGADPLTFNNKMKKLVEKHVSSDRQKYVSFYAQPLSEIHFNIGNFNQRMIAKETIHTLQLIGLFILIVGCINFINLATAQALKRAKEVGIRKTLGGARARLVIQFLCETFLIIIISLMVSFILASQLLPFSQKFFNIPLSSDALFTASTGVFMLFIVVAVTLLSGFYPAFVLSGYQPAMALKGNGLIAGIKGLYVRKGLITFQFAISQVLIVSTIVVILQINHFLSMPLGFNKDAVVTFDLPNSDTTVLSSLRNNLLSHSEIIGVSFSLNTPSATINKWWANLKHHSFSGDEKEAEVKFIDSVYLKMFEINKVVGSTLLPDKTGKSVIVNEALVKEIGISDPEKAIGEKITYWNTDATIIGVVKDFQTVTLREGMHPVILTNTGYFAKGSVKIEMSRVSEALANIEKHWMEAFAGNYYSYAFLDDQLATFYSEEKKISRLLVSFAIVAICIGSIGLYGLIALVATQRSKEVSIRKILGASVTNLASLLSGDFIRLVLLAGLLACPIAWYALDKWLQGFANRIYLTDNAWVFLLSIAAGLLIALIAVSYQTIKAALMSPVNNLKSE